MISQSRIEAEVLSFLEDDYYGLWETIGIVAGLVGEASASEAAKQLVARLFERGWVALFHRAPQNSFIPILPVQATQALLDDNNWLPPPASSVWITTTAQGDEAYRALSPETFRVPRE